MLIKEYKVYNEQEVLDLYNSVGWSAYTNNPSSLKNAFKNSLLILGAYEEDELIGLIRIVGDGFTIIFIQDILISPEHQRKGAGSKLIKEVIDMYKDVRQIELMTDDTEKTKAFYNSLNFRDVSKIGCVGFIYQK